MSYNSLPPPNVPPPPPPPRAPISPPDTPPPPPPDIFTPDMFVDPNNPPPEEGLGEWAPPWCMAAGKRGHCYEDPFCECNCDGEYAPVPCSDDKNVNGEGEVEEMEEDGGEENMDGVEQDQGTEYGETRGTKRKRGGDGEEDDEMMPESSRARRTGETKTS